MTGSVAWVDPALPQMPTTPPKLLAGAFPDFEALEKNGREQRLPIEDILDALVACWSALRLASGKARKLTETIARDRTGLPMTT
jgi:predicted RNase H-like nuclease